MALQVWLPLRGDATNLGFAKCNFRLISNCITVNDNGKIGKCYEGVVPSAASGNSGVYSEDLGFMAKYINHKSFSLCAWVNTTASNTPVIFLSYGLGLSVGDSTHVTLRLGDSTRTITCVANVAVNDGQWHHVAGTYDTETNKLKIYVDGNLRNTTDYVSGITYASTWTNGLYVYRNPNNSLLNEGYFYNGKANDIRVYDHCLSGQEIKDISMGLVAHYQLKDSAIESTTNLVTRLTNGGQTTLGKNNMSVITSGANSDTYFTINLSENIVSGTQYTISCDVKGMVEGKGWTFPIGSQSNTSLAWVLYNGHNEKTFTANDITWGSQRIFMDDNGGRDAGIGQNVTFYNFQVEKKDHATVRTIGSRTGITKVYDSSGFGNHATISGTPTVTSDSAKYSLSTFFNQNGYLNNTDFAINLDTFTLNMWINPKTMTTSQHFLFGTFTSWTNHGIGIWRDSTSPSKYNCLVKSDAESTYKLESIVTTLNAWNMLTLVYNGTSVTGYCNGVQKYNVTYGLNGKVINYNLMLANSKYNSTSASENDEVAISDFRLYVTALSAEDVKNLYQTAAHAFQNGYSAYEFVEG